MQQADFSSSYLTQHGHDGHIGHVGYDEHDGHVKHDEHVGHVCARDLRIKHHSHVKVPILKCT